MHVSIPVLVLLQQFWATTAQPSFLNVTAIAGVGGRSVFQCWQLETPFTVSADAGTSGVARANLGDVRDFSYFALPSNYDGGLHTAPANQWVAFVSGVARFTLPDDPAASVTVVGGDFGLIFAADTANVSKQGHISQYPSNTETIALQIPVRDGKVPAHEVLHEGACGANEVVGIRAIATQGRAQEHGQMCGLS
ncbi:small secreted protein, partial [Metarhizium majus ARSEF 297]